MKTVISKKDGKKYYLCEAEFDAGIGNGVRAVCRGERYQVRKATAEDCKDFRNYCVVNGTFNDTFDALEYDKIGINHYNGTRCEHMLLTVEFCRKVFKYID